MATNGEAGARSEGELDDTEETGKLDWKGWQELERAILMAKMPVNDAERMQKV